MYASNGGESGGSADGAPGSDESPAVTLESTLVATADGGRGAGRPAAEVTGAKTIRRDRDPAIDAIS